MATSSSRRGGDGVTVKRRYGTGAVTKLPSGMWRARQRVDGRLVSVGTYPTKAAASDALENFRVSVRNGDWSPEPVGAPTVPTFAAALEQYITHRVTRKKLRVQTADDYRAVARRWLGCGDTPTGFGAKRIDDITRADCNAIVDESVRRRHRPGTTKNIVRIVRAVMNYAVVDGGWRTANPAQALTVPEADDDPAEMVVLTVDQVEALAVSFDHAPYGTLIRLTVYGGGLRAGEAEGLRCGDYDPFTRSLRVVRRIREGIEDAPKSATSRRTNVLDDELAAEVAALVAGRPAEEPMFLTPTGVPHRHDRFYRPVFKPAAARAGLPTAIRFHDLRHSGISLLLAAGMPVVDVAKWCGHASPVITMTTYSHVIPSEVDRPARAFSRLRADHRDGERRLRIVAGVA